MSRSMWLAPHRGEQRRRVDLLAVEDDPVDLRAQEVARLAGIEVARADEVDVRFGDLLHARPEERRDLLAADVGEAHPADEVRRCGRDGVEVAVRVEVHEEHVGLDRQRPGDRSRDERALSAEDPDARPRLQRRRDRVGEQDAGITRRGEPAIARVEWDADALLGCQTLRECRPQGGRSFGHPHAALLGDEARLEQVERPLGIGHQWRGVY